MRGAHRALALGVALLFFVAATASALAHSTHPTGPTASASSPGAPAGQEVTLGPTYDAGTARSPVDGERNVWAIHMSQTLQPSGPYETGSLESSMDLELTETVDVLEEGTGRINLEVTAAEAFGFQAGIEQEEARGRTLTYSYDDRGITIPAGEESFDFFGIPGQLHMVDMAVRAHLLNPVLPSAPRQERDTLQDEALLPTGWTRFTHSVEGTTTIGATEGRRGVDVVNLTATRRADTEIAIPAINNPVNTFRGGEPDLNEFFLATLFKVLVPEGTTPESVLPEFPLQVGEAHLHEHSHERRRRKGERTRRSSPKALLAGLAMLAVTACTGNPAVAQAVTSVRLQGPIELSHSALVHEASGVLVHSRTDASARLSGRTIRVDDEAALADLGEQLAAMTDQELAIEATWSIEQNLVSDLPSDRSWPEWPLAAGLTALAAAGIALLIRRTR